MTDRYPQWVTLHQLPVRAQSGGEDQEGTCPQELKTPTISTPLFVFSFSFDMC